MSTTAVPFSWTPSGASSVEVAGSWDAFQGRTLLQRTESGSFKGEISLPAASTVQYKFIVDGTWRTSPGIPTQDDGHGNANHVLHVPEASALPQETPGLEVPGAYLASTPGLGEEPPTAAELTQGASGALGGATAVAAGATAGAAGTAAAFMASVNGDAATGTEAEMQASAITVDQVVPPVVTNTIADTLGAQVVGMDAVRPAQQPASAAVEGASASQSGSASAALADAGAGAPLPTVGSSAVPAYEDLSKVAEQQGRTPADAGAVAIAAAQASITGAVAPGQTTRDVRGTEQLETVKGAGASAAPAAPAASSAAPAGAAEKHGAAAAATAAGAALGAGAIATATGVAKKSDAAQAPKAAPTAPASQKNGSHTAPTAAGAALGAGAVATATGVVAGQKEASKASRPSSVRSKRNSVQLGRTPSNASTASRRGPSGANGTNSTVSAKPTVVGAAAAAPALGASANIRRSSDTANKKDLPAAPRGGAGKPAAVAAPLPAKASARKSATPAASAAAPAEKPAPAAPVTPQKSTVKEKRGSRFGSMSRRKSNVDFDKLAQEHPLPGTQAAAAKSAAPAPAAAASPAAVDPTTPDRKRKQSIFGKIKSVITPTSSPSK